MKKYIQLILLILCFILNVFIAQAQKVGQTIKGNIVDKQSLQPLQGVQISILGLPNSISAIFGF